MKKQPKIFIELEKIAPLIPSALYWTDLDLVILGENQLCAKIGNDLSGLDTSSFKGKGPFDMYPSEVAEMIHRNNNVVLQNKRTMVFVPPR